MIVCQECGNAAPSADGFCSSCGVLLEWSGQHVESPAPPPPLAPPLATMVAVQPDEEAVRPAPTPVAPPDRHGGLFCSVCGTRNAEGRAYCRYCGNALDVTVPVPVRRRWWQRLFRRRKRGRAAGDRPRGFRSPEAAPGRKRRRLRVPVAKAVPVLAVLSLAGIGLGPARGWISQHASTLFGDAKKHVGRHFVPVVPVSATASTSAPGHAPKLGIDGVRNTWWQSRGHPDGVGETVTVRFASPVDVNRIGVLSGPDGDKFRAQGRPRTMEITTDGRPHGQVSLDDKAGFQSRDVRLHDVTSLTLVVTAAYPGQGGGHAVAIRELQFFELKTDH